MTNCILASTSTIHEGIYLEYLFPVLKELFKEAKEIIFIPYARPGGISHDTYTSIAANAFEKINIKVKGLHTFKNPEEAISKAQGIFTGGGNSFVLLSELYKNDIITTLKDAILSGTPYLGTSAGSNIAGISIKTTNDMPIVYPPNYTSLGIIPFNINPHYLDPDPNSTHKGETRETRIKEFHMFNNTPVVGLREGSWIQVKGDTATLEGYHLTARIFTAEKEPYEVVPKTLLHF